MKICRISSTVIIQRTETNEHKPGLNKIRKEDGGNLLMMKSSQGIKRTLIFSAWLIWIVFLIQIFLPMKSLRILKQVWNVLRKLWLRLMDALTNNESVWKSGSHGNGTGQANSKKRIPRDRQHHFQIIDELCEGFFHLFDILSLFVQSLPQPCYTPSKQVRISDIGRYMKKTWRQYLRGFHSQRYFLRHLPRPGQGQ